MTNTRQRGTHHIFPTASLSELLVSVRLKQPLMPRTFELGVHAVSAEGAEMVRKRSIPMSMADAAVALTTADVLPPDSPVAVLSGALATGGPSYDAVIAEHVPLLRGGESCRACGFVYTDRRVCPALILAAAGFPVLADRVRVVPAADPEHRAMCELTVAVQRMDARLDMIGARIAPETARTKRSLP